MKQFYLILSPKRGWREGCNFYVKTVEAESAKAALLKTPITWPVGDKSYKKVECYLADHGIELTL